MSIYSARLEELQTSLSSSIDRLNEYAGLASGATTIGSYNSYVDKWNSEKTFYNTTVASYDDTVESADRYATFKMVETRSVDLPNKKDRQEAIALAGNVLGNETWTGDLWSPTSMGTLPTTKLNVDNNANLLNGNLLTYLGAGIGSMMAFMQGGVLNLAFDDDIRETIILTIRLEMIDVKSGTTISSRKIDYNSGDSSSELAPSKDMNPLSLQATLDAWESRSDIRTVLARNPIALSLSIFNHVTQDRVSVETRLAGAVIGTVKGVFSELVSKSIAQAIGFAPTGIVPALAFASIVGSILTELTEMALGLDTHFGFGGEYVGTAMTGKHFYTQPMSITEGLYSMYQGYDVRGDALAKMELENQNLAIEQSLAYGISIQDVDIANIMMDAEIEAMVDEVAGIDTITYTDVFAAPSATPFDSGDGIDVGGLAEEATPGSFAGFEESGGWDW